MTGAAIAVVSVFVVSYSMKKDTLVSLIPSKIGAFIRCLIPIQGAFILFGDKDMIAVALIVYAMWPISIFTSRIVSGS